VIRAIERGLRAKCSDVFCAAASEAPGGLFELYSHVDELVQIVRRSTAGEIEPYLAEILEDVCSNCTHQDASGYCPLRKAGRCALYAHAGAVIEAVARALGELHDEPYEGVHRPKGPPLETVPSRAREASACDFGRILIAVDTDDASHDAIVLGLQLAARVAARVALVHVLPPLAGHMAEPTEASRRTHDADRDHANAMFHEIRRDVPGRTDVIEFVREGYPAEEIVDVARAWKADLIVVGTHGSGRVTSFLLGSTTQAVIREASCPVLVVRPQPTSPATAAN
jgi:nucleotide-binding universal stress UspA family protein